MLKISCIIVDDERIAREGMEKYISKIDFLELKGTFKNAIDANSFLSSNNVDVMFLDIEMPMLSGIDFLKSLPQAPYTIFTTAYSHYALEGYKYDVIDYLVKPISFERFMQAVNKLVRIINKQNQAQLNSVLPNEANSTELFIKADNKIIKLHYSDILYIEGMQNYVNIVTKQQKITSRMTLKNLTDALPENKFIKIHKSYIVAKDRMEAIEGNLVQLGSYKLPISRRLKNEVVMEFTQPK